MAAGPQPRKRGVRVNGSEHYRKGEQLLAQASHTNRYGIPVDKDGALLPPGVHEALLGRAQVHFAAAHAAATALPTVIRNMGDSEEIARWGRVTGAATTWIAVLTSPDPETVIEYGPFRDEAEATAFAAYLRAEVDPAYATGITAANPREFRSPVTELLTWYKRSRGGAQ